MEHTSDVVYTGKVVDESSYAREEKSVDIDGVINIDWIDTKTGIIHEVKKSDSVEKAHEMQVLYYLWYLKQKGVAVEGNLLPGTTPAEGYLLPTHAKGGLHGKVEGSLEHGFGEEQGNLQRGKGLRGEIDYPLLKQKTIVTLTPENERELEQALANIEAIVQQHEPPERINKKFCKTCSYFELCWVGHG
jgi:CRISPR-associated exonuclease Cas4